MARLTDQIISLIESLPASSEVADMLDRLHTELTHILAEQKGSNIQPRHYGDIAELPLEEAKSSAITYITGYIVPMVSGLSDDHYMKEQTSQYGLDYKDFKNGINTVSKFELIAGSLPGITLLSRAADILEQKYKNYLSVSDLEHLFAIHTKPPKVVELREILNEIAHDPEREIPLANGGVKKAHELIIYSFRPPAGRLKAHPDIAPYLADRLGISFSPQPPKDIKLIQLATIIRSTSARDYFAPVYTYISEALENPQTETEYQDWRAKKSLPPAESALAYYKPINPVNISRKNQTYDAFFTPDFGNFLKDRFWYLLKETINSKTLMEKLNHNNGSTANIRGSYKALGQVNSIAEKILRERGTETIEIKPTPQHPYSGSLKICDMMPLYVNSFRFFDLLETIALFTPEKLAEIAGHETTWRQQHQNRLDQKQTVTTR